jgi:hypothetical protein
MFIKEELVGISWTASGWLRRQISVSEAATRVARDARSTSITRPAKGFLVRVPVFLLPVGIEQIIQKAFHFLHHLLRVRVGFEPLAEVTLGFDQKFE